MPFEIAPSVIKKIETSQEAVEVKIMSLQLRFAAALWEKTLPFAPEDAADVTAPFEELLIGYAGISETIHEEYRKQTGIDPVTEGDWTSFKVFERKVTSRIKNEYENDRNEWISKVPGIIKNEIEALPKGEKHSLWTEEVYGENSTSDEAGFIDYDVWNFSHAIPGLEMPEGSSTITLHLGALVDIKKNNKEVINLFSNDSLKKLAENIISKHPQAAVIRAQSWIVDSPIGKRMGFNIYTDESDSWWSINFWGQFIDMNGEVKQKEVEHFFATGEAPYQVKSGYILMDEFLKKYGPEKV